MRAPRDADAGTGALRPPAAGWSVRGVGRRERVRFRVGRQVYIAHGSWAMGRGGLHWLVLGALELIISVVRLFGSVQAKN